MLGKAGVWAAVVSRAAGHGRALQRGRGQAPGDVPCHAGWPGQHGTCAGSPPPLSWAISAGGPAPPGEAVLCGRWQSGGRGQKLGEKRLAGPRRAEPRAEGWLTGLCALSRRASLALVVGGRGQGTL